MIKSPLRYPGGKSRAVDLISTLVPEFDEFREPFLGGGSIFIYLKQKFPEKIFWVNDLHHNLFKFWEMAQKDVNVVIEKIYEWRHEFEKGKDLHKFLTSNISDFKDIETAAAFFIFNRITFSGTSESGGYSEQSYHGRFTESSIERLKKFAEVTKDARITNTDYEDLVTAPGQDVFIFLDPPYYSARKSALYGKNGNLHKGFDHVHFADVMKNCKHNWLITYDDSEYIRNLFPFANIIPWNLIYGMRNVTETSDQMGKELFISNYLESISQFVVPEKQGSLFDPKNIETSIS